MGARAPRTAPTRVAIGSRTATCTHHDGERAIVVRNFAEACERLRINQNSHMDSQKWADIGYNYLVVSAPGYPAVDGLIFDARGRDVVGAHCLDHNTAWVGIQVAIGGAQKPSPAALRSVRVLHDWCATEAGHFLAKKGPATSCPGPELYAWVHAGMPFASSPGTPPVKPPATPPAETPGEASDGVWGPRSRAAWAVAVARNLGKY